MGVDEDVRERREDTLEGEGKARSSLVRVAASTQQITTHAGLALVRLLGQRLAVAASLDQITVK